ncbi:MAG: LysR family transcriptional regulator [Oceanicaulis sp. HLUCCA04]|nr:MAG: LysR family transcriptional regulator [Oceanicaulis sp. HLUCCA04]
MNWQAITFDWNHARAFLVTVHTGSLSAAARALGSTQPTLSRQVSAFEAEIGVTLFERTQRSMRPTAAGRAIAVHVRRMADNALELALSAAGQSASLSGTVTIAAADLTAAYHLPAALIRLREIAPQIRVGLAVSDTISDLKARDADIAIRHVRPTQPDLIARLLGEVTAGIYASPAYLSRQGPVRTRGDLRKMTWIGFSEPERVTHHLANYDLELPASAIGYWTADGNAILEMVRAGLGLSVLPADIAATGNALVPVLPDLFRIQVPVWLVTHRELLTNPRIRLVFDVLAEQLAP